MNAQSVFVNCSWRCPGTFAHTLRCPCTRTSRRLPYSSNSNACGKSRALQGSQTETRELLGGTTVTSVPNKGSLISPPLRWANTGPAPPPILRTTKQVFSMNAQSKFLSNVLSGVLGCLRTPNGVLVQGEAGDCHIFPIAMQVASREPFKGPRRR